MSQRKAREARRRNAPDKRASSGGSPRRPRILVGVAAALVAVLVVVGVIVARGTGPSEAVAVASGPAVSFTGTDPVNGKTVSVADYEGKPVVINVWGSWCPGCIEEAADLETFVQRHPEVQMIGVDLQDSRDGARAFYEQWGWTHPSVFDPDGAISFSLGLQGTPTTFFLDAEHRVVTRIIGATNLAGFERGLEQALARS